MPVSHTLFAEVIEATARLCKSITEVDHVLIKQSFGNDRGIFPASHDQSD
jgi:hypothetical protein